MIDVRQCLMEAQEEGKKIKTLMTAKLQFSNFCFLNGKQKLSNKNNFV